MGMTYRDAGVDIDAGEELVRRIKPLAAATTRPGVLGSLGGFAGLFALPKMHDPVLVSGTDGVGTKLKLAFSADRHDTVGIDLVAMCVNDVLTIGAEPLFFLDYFATGELDVGRAEAVVRGIAEGCKQAGCALLGGETAELPGFYGGGEYDLAGFVVGVVERDAILDGSNVREGDALIALPSSGLHSNGFSLARRALEGQLKGEVLDALLTPTRIYASAVRAALAAGGVTAMAHITGGGLTDNVPRVLGDSLDAHIDTTSWQLPTIFQRISEAGSVETSEMRRTFNLGVGYVFVVAAAHEGTVMKALQEAGESPWRVGEVRAGEGRVVYR
ncbi:MAG: phosphoribosylformylglycinamidine cyclo-ligase [Myxococcota bacterium]